MARSAGTVRIVFEAGTASFVADVDKAKAKVLDYGGSASSAMRAAGGATKVSMAESGAAIKALEGNFNGTHKAVTRFLSLTLGLGPVLAAAFPVIGAVMLGTAVAGVAGKVSSFFKELQNAPEKVAGAWRQLAAPLKQTNDELALTNARLENDIAKLEGRRQNTLKTALYEARVEADKLADSLEKDIGKLNAFLTENAVSGFSGWLKSLFGANMTTDLKDLIGGKSGAGGFSGDIAKINLAGQANIDRAIAAGDVKGEQAARVALDQALANRTRRLLSDVGDIESAATRKVPKPGAKGAPSALGPIYEPEQLQAVSTMDAAKSEQVQAIKNAASEMLRYLGQSGANAALTGRKNELTTATENSKLEKPFRDRINAIYAQIEAATSRMNAAGLDEGAKVMAKAYGDAEKAITDVNKALENQNRQLGESEKHSIRAAFGMLAQTEAEADWKTKLAESTAAVRDKVRGQEMLTAAIGRGAEAERRVRVETQVMGAVGAERYNDPKWMAAHAGDVDRLRSGFGGEVEAQRVQGSAAAVYALGEEIRLQNLLIEAQKLGEEEIRRITAMEIWRQGILKGSSGQEIVAQISKYYGEIRLEQEKRINATKAETTYTEKLAVAQLRGAEAVRKQQLENKYAEMERAGAGREVPSQRILDEKAHQAEITKEVAARVTLYTDEMTKLDQERARLLEIIGAHKATVEQARALRDLQQERLALWVKEQLAIGTARAGVRAFFAEMQAGSKRIGNIIYETLTSAVDRVSDELTKLMTGQKTSFGKMLQELGQETLRSSIKSGLEKGLGELGKVLGIKMPEGKPDGTTAKPYHVIVDNKPGTGSPDYSPVPDSMKIPGSAVPAIGGFLKGVGGFLGKLFGGGAGGGGEEVSSSVSYMAKGGPLSASDAYIVGEDGPELLTRTSGHITSNADLRRSLGGGGHTFHTTVDARGAELGVEHRVYRAIDRAHRSAVSSAVQVANERAKRVPQRSNA